MKKIVINACHGGFGLSQKAQDMYCVQKNIDPGKWERWGYYSNFHENELCRDDPILIEIVEKLGEEASGDHAELRIVEVPEDVNWYIEEYDGSEWVAERHRTWR